MFRPRTHAALLCGVAFAAVAGADFTHAQQSLPGINVDAPSPIARRKPAPPKPEPTVRRAARTPAVVIPQSLPPPAIEAPLQGTLPIVTDQFATVTVVPNEEIRRSGAATLGDLLDTKPGITGSSFAPGASSRPIIRGLDVNRVGITENGIASGGASDLGEDHFVPIDPLATSQVEVVRGPATLRYGSQSIGGIVSATNNRIPESAPCAVTAPFPTYGIPVKAPVAVSPAPCVTFETRGGYDSVSNGRDGAVLLDAGGRNFAVHADGYVRKTDDYRIPKNPYVFDPGRPFNGKQLNSATQSEGGSVGGSYLFTGGFIGAAISQTNSLYRIPGAEGEEFGTRIDAKQTKFTAKGEYRPDATAIDAIRFWAGATDYKHNELGRTDEFDPSTDGVRQTFTNREQEGRVEVQFAPLDVRFAALTTAVGVQAAHQRLTAAGDAPGEQFSGLFDPNRNTRIAGYMFNEFKFSDTTKAQIAGRVENVSLRGGAPDFPADFLPDGIDRPNIARNRDFTPMSASAGLIQSLGWDLTASLTAQYVERAPKPAELFSRGAHEATRTFDIGNPNLKIERAQSVEAGLRRANGPLRFELTAYYTRFNGFIFRNLTGVNCGETFATCGDPAEELNQAVYAQRNATFRGGEFQFQYDVLPVWAGMFGVEGQYDIVRATFTDGTNVPRIPPQRLGGGIYYRDAGWLARIHFLHAFAQNNIGGIETATPGYNRLKAEISYTHKLKPTGFGAQEFTVGLIGDNLLNDDIRSHVSFTKDEVLLPGLSVRAFANVKF
ncbi:MAG: TonB-dependent receptor [Pseudomonadota bacterium]